MSQGFERETTASTAKSLLGALVALGSGFIFMVMGMVAVTANNVKVEGDKSARSLVRTVQNDMLSLDIGGVQVAPDKKSLKLHVTSPGSPSTQVVYRVGEVGDITRAVGESNQKLARLKGASFELSGKLLRLSWTAADGPAKASWATGRWSGSAGRPGTIPPSGSKSP